MRVIKFTNTANWPILRQSPGASGCWDDCLFCFSEHLKECDHWVVYDGLPREETVLCPPGNTYFITGETADFRTYDPRFLAQFGAVITGRGDIVHPRAIVTCQLTGWHVGMDSRVHHPLPRSDPDRAGTYGPERTYDYFKALDWRAAKTKNCSFITSNKGFLPGHRDRLAFTYKLVPHFGERIDVFGAGILINGRHVDLVDKESGILPYKYHIVVENQLKPNYFTEKLQDCYLCGAMPIYHGCTNIEEYVPAEAVIRIDIRDPEAAFRTIEEALVSGRWEHSLDAIAEARRRMLDEYNFFPAVARCATGPKEPREPVRLLPESAFR